MTRDALHIAGKIITPGTDVRIDLETAQLYTNSQIHMPVRIFHGKKDGPVLLLCAAIHGDEINGIEIIRQIIKDPALKNIKGTLIAVPIVNQLGFIQQTRYLPDRRDLNRNFPGSDTGSLAARVAHQFMENIVTHATHIIDLHTAAIHRTNLPQIRTDISDKHNLAMAKAFGMPVLLNSGLLEGTLRCAASAQKKHAIAFEGGEALRFNRDAIKAGVQGVRNVLAHLGMVKSNKALPTLTPTIANSSLWVRANTDGMLVTDVALGEHIEQGQTLGVINDPFGDNPIKVTSPVNGIIIGQTTIPLVHQGEAIFHVASFKTVSSVAEKINELRSFIETH